MIQKYIRSDLQNFQPYSTPSLPYKVKMDSNESPFPLPEEIKQELIQWIKTDENLNRYPDTDTTQLRKELGKVWNMKKENIICGVGSDQLIDCMMKVFLEPKDKVLIPSPSFSMYALTARMNHGIPIEVPLKDNYDYGSTQIVEAYKKYQPKIVILCTPNNPTGNSLSIEEIEKIVSQISCPILIDEAYGEFAGESMIPLVEKFPHLFVIRTFSKAFGLAGIRVGYGIGSKDIIDAISITKPPFNISTLSEKIALLALKQVPTYHERIQLLQEEKKWLKNQLESMGCQVYSSKANFLLTKIEKKNIRQALMEKQILVRDFSKHPNLSHCIRITIGTRHENELFLKALREILFKKEDKS